MVTQSTTTSYTSTVIKLVTMPVRHNSVEFFFCSLGLLGVFFVVVWWWVWVCSGFGLGFSCLVGWVWVLWGFVWLLLALLSACFLQAAPPAFKKWLLLSSTPNLSCVSRKKNHHYQQWKQETNHQSQLLGLAKNLCSFISQNTKF